MKLIQAIHTAKIYDMNENERNKNSVKLMEQLYKENNYLRKANLGNLLLTDNVYLYKNDIENKHENTNKCPKHKRQPTHINLTNMYTDGDNRKKNNTSNEIISGGNNNEDCLTITLVNMNEEITTRLRRNDSCKEIKTDNDLNGFPSNNTASTNDSNNNSNNPMKPLCYKRAINPKEKKLIEFTK